jgi:hypothetical protein
MAVDASYSRAQPLSLVPADRAAGLGREHTPWEEQESETQEPEDEAGGEAESEAEPEPKPAATSGAGHDAEPLHAAPPLDPLVATFQVPSRARRRGGCRARHPHPWARSSIARTSLTLLAYHSQHAHRSQRSRCSHLSHRSHSTHIAHIALRWRGC